jgi:hypothetical protein
MDRRFLEALIHRDHRVLGYRLRPYCLAHSVTLEAIGHPLASGDALFSPGDIIAFLKAVSAPDPFRPDFRPTLWDKLQAFRLRNPETRARVLAQIAAYFEDFASMPTLFQEELKSGPGEDFIEPNKAAMSAPWVASRLASLHLHTNLTDAEIFSKPLGYLMWLDAAIAETSGAKVSFFDPENPDLTADDIEELRKAAKEPVPIPTGENPDWFSDRQV